MNPMKRLMKTNIFSQKQEILLMQRLDIALAVLADNLGLDDERDPALLRLFAGFDSEHGEASRKTGDTSEDGFEGLGLMMRDEVFKDLDGRDP